MKIAFIGSMAVLMSSCASMHDSLQLGATMGALTGGVSTMAAHSSVGGKASVGDVALGAGIGLGLGVLAAYITHKQVEEDRSVMDNDRTEMHFGDLPPSPFIMPKISTKGGAR